MLFSVDETNVFLAGSVHFGKADYYPLHGAIEQVFNAAENIWFESLPPIPNHPIFFCPNGSTLRDYVSSPLYCALRFHQLNNFDQIKTLRPWVIALKFVRAAYEAEGCNLDYGVESWFTKRANDANKTIRYLEQP